MDQETNYYLQTENEKIPFRVINKKGLRTIRLQMKSDGLTVSKPQHIGMRDIHRILEEKKRWVLKTYAKIREREASRPQRNWEIEEQVLFMGEPRRVKIVNHDKMRVSVSFTGDHFEIFVPTGMGKLERKKAIEETFQKWYVENARPLLQRSAKFWAERMGVAFLDIRIKNTKTRWGSCSAKGNLNFNWKLLMAPPFVLEYVVIHELCHLVHLNHSKAFWRLVSHQMPDYKKAEAWLKNNGPTLGFEEG